MRIGQVADAVGVTPRAVRHYHRLGLLDEPERKPNGYRDYTMDDVVRLLRIRWLAGNGVPLGSISAMLTRDRVLDPIGDNADVVHDLHCLIEIAGTERDAAARRIERLTRMLDAAEACRRITALPSAVSEAFDYLELTALDEDVANAVVRDRDFLEAMVIGGTVSDDALVALGAVAADPEQRTQYMAVLGRWVELHGKNIDVPDIDAEIDSIATALVDFSSTVLHLAVPSDRSTAASHGVDESQIASAVPDRAQREAIVRAIRLIADAR